MRDRTVATTTTIVVIAYGLVNLAHAAAHSELSVEMSRWQEAFILIVIGCSPLAAAVLLWTVYERLGAQLLTGSMAAALVFGAYYHYVAVSSDHVDHLPPGDAQVLFRATALLIALSQALGTIVGLWGIRRLRAAM